MCKMMISRHFFIFFEILIWTVRGVKWQKITQVRPDIKRLEISSFYIMVPKIMAKNIAQNKK